MRPRSRSPVRTPWRARSSASTTSGSRSPSSTTGCPYGRSPGLYLESRRLLDRATRWLLQSRRSLLDVETEIEHFAQVKGLITEIPQMLQGRRAGAAAAPGR